MTIKNENNLSIKTMMAYMAASDKGYFDKDVTGEIHFHLTDESLSQQPTFEPVMATDIPAIFACWAKNNTYINEDLPIDEPVWAMILEMWSEDMIFLSRYDEVAGNHQGRLLPVVGANDVFYWACADCESATFAEIPLLYSLWKQPDDHLNLIRWVCERRNMRPQLPIIEWMTANGYDVAWLEPLSIPAKS